VLSVFHVIVTTMSARPRPTCADSASSRARVVQRNELDDLAQVAESRLPLAHQRDLVVGQREIEVAHPGERLGHRAVGLGLVGSSLGDPAEQVERLREQPEVHRREPDVAGEHGVPGVVLDE
jgi:hypothetical protein